MILERLNSIKDDLDLFEDDLNKYEFIVDLGKDLPPLSKEYFDDSFLVKGCTSKVWLIAELEDGTIHFVADSNSVIVKGLISILISIFQGLSPKEILSFDTEKLSILNLAEIISPTRQNGVFHMINKIKHYAEVYRGSI